MDDCRRGGGEEQDQSPAEAATTTYTPACFVIVYNVAKRHNVGNLLRSCTAFGVKAACLVGSREFNGFGAHGAADDGEDHHVETLFQRRALRPCTRTPRSRDQQPLCWATRATA